MPLARKAAWISAAWVLVRTSTAMSPARTPRSPILAIPAQQPGDISGNQVRDQGNKLFLDQPPSSGWAETLGQGEKLEGLRAEGWGMPEIFRPWPGGNPGVADAAIAKRLGQRAVQTVQRRHHFPVGPPVGGHGIFFRLRLTGGLKVGIDIRAPEGIDGLLGIADQKESLLAASPVDGPEDAVLDRIGVLKLVDERHRKPGPDPLGQLRPCPLAALQGPIQPGEELIKGLLLPGQQTLGQFGPDIPRRPGEEERLAAVRPWPRPGQPICPKARRRDCFAPTLFSRPLA